MTYYVGIVDGSRRRLGRALPGPARLAWRRRYAGRGDRRRDRCAAGLLEQIDAEARRRGLTRSAFLVSAALDKIAFGR